MTVASARHMPWPSDQDPGAKEGNILLPSQQNCTLHTAHFSCFPCLAAPWRCNKSIVNVSSFSIQLNVLTQSNLKMKGFQKWSVFIVQLLPPNVSHFEESFSIKLLFRANIDKLLWNEVQPCHCYDQVVLAVKSKGNQNQISQMCSHSALELGFVWNGVERGGGNKAVAVKFCFWTIYFKSNKPIQTDYNELKRS